MAKKIRGLLSVAITINRIIFQSQDPKYLNYLGFMLTFSLHLSSIHKILSPNPNPNPNPKDIIKDGAINAEYFVHCFFSCNGIRESVIWSFYPFVKKNKRKRKKIYVYYIFFFFNHPTKK